MEVLPRTTQRTVGTAVQKVLVVAEALSRAGPPHHLADIAYRAGLPKASVHRILHELAEAGFVACHPRGTYGPGYRLLGLASELLAEDAGQGTVGWVLRGLRDATGYTVHVGVRSATDAVYVYKVESTQPYQMSSRIGMRLALHCTAIGKSILASLNVDELGELLAQLDLSRHTDRTITRRAVMLKELSEVRRRGFAIDNEENEYNVRCVGAPVTDASGAIFGSLSVSALTFELSEERALEIGTVVKEAAGQLTTALSRNGTLLDDASQ